MRISRSIRRKIEQQQHKNSKQTLKQKKDSGVQRIKGGVYHPSSPLLTDRSSKVLLHTDLQCSREYQLMLWRWASAEVPQTWQAIWKKCTIPQITYNKLSSSARSETTPGACTMRSSINQRNCQRKIRQWKSTSKRRKENQWWITPHKLRKRNRWNLPCNVIQKSMWVTCQLKIESWLNQPSWKRLINWLQKIEYKLLQYHR